MNTLDKYEKWAPLGGAVERMLMGMPSVASVLQMLDSIYYRSKNLEIATNNIKNTLSRIYSMNEVTAESDIPTAVSGMKKYKMELEDFVDSLGDVETIINEAKLQTSKRYYDTFIDFRKSVYKIIIEALNSIDKNVNEIKMGTNKEIDLIDNEVKKLEAIYDEGKKKSEKYYSEWKVHKNTPTMVYVSLIAVFIVLAGIAVFLIRRKKGSF